MFISHLSVIMAERERISLLMMRGWEDRQRSYNEVRILFNETFRDPNNGISKSTVERTIRRFEETGTNKNRPKSGRPISEATEEKAFEVAQTFVENPRLSVRKASQQLQMSKTSVCRNLKSINFHPYKMHLVQELNEDDFDRRNEFCDIMMTRIDQFPNFLFNITFSDEASFELNGNVNRHNCRFWSNDNPHWIREAHTQHPEKLNVWAGIYNNTLIGPFFIDGTLNANRYERMLRDQIIPSIVERADDNFDEVWYQQDGAPPHYGRAVRAYLDETFPNRWIGRRGAIEWPARSPDLTPLDYFLWGYLKNKIYFTEPNDLEDLRQRIMREAALIPPDVIRSAVENFYVRLQYCQTVDGAQFEHLL